MFTRAVKNKQHLKIDEGLSLSLSFSMCVCLCTHTYLVEGIVKEKEEKKVSEMVKGMI